MLMEEARRELARRTMGDFVLYVDDNYRMNWHHRLLCDYLDKLACKEIRRLMVFMPPRHGKSELVSRKFPAYLLGRNPDTSIISCSYSADLASRMNRDVQRLIDSEQYLELFPGTQLSNQHTRRFYETRYTRNNNMFEVVDKKGTYRSSGVGGGITGMGGEYIIIDDPVKNREDADSATMREKVYDWYTSTLYTRLEKDGCILLTLTRWHEDDLAGKLLKAAQEGADQWTILELPAVCEYPPKPYDVRQEGEALWKWKYDEEALEKMKVTVGSRDWAALYQQHPTPGEGGTFKREWWNYYKVLPDGLYDFVQSWDCTFKDAQSSDYVVGQVWARKGSSRYLLDQVRGRMSFTETLRAIRSLSAKWPQAIRKLVEDKANGTAVIDVLRKEIPGLIPVEPEGGKIVRANAVTAVAEAGNIYLPDPSIAPWVHDFVEEHAVFPNGANDDQVDAQTQANTYYNSSSFSLEGLI
ncbi:MAG: phage terminase large subunit [Clostridium sp.]|nr:phage terminase large subunit [Clostridium sp.]